MKNLTAILNPKRRMTTGKKIKNYRESFNLSQIDLCNMLNMSQSSLSAFENDKRTLSISTAIRFSAIFNVDPLDLLYPNGINKTKEWVETKQRIKKTASK